ncbi:putative reverse transcriptase domain-containing protein [Tanacetum coccineum]|uniref:Reverse transcriptase domain-containing protein n=1 Tax=Tanacetum coccineum TaxID=301880 RepID=A0ABQ5CU85_9ASTR
MPEDILSLSGGAVEVSMSIGEILVRSFHDHTQAIPGPSFYRLLREFRGVSREQDCGVRELTTPGGMSRMQRELRQIRRLRFYDRVRIDRLEACAKKHMGYLKKWRLCEEQDLEPMNEWVMNKKAQRTGGRKWRNGNGGNGGNGNGNRNGNHEVYYPRNEIQKMEAELWNLTVKGNDMTAYTQRDSRNAITLANQLMDKKVQGYAARSAENKRRMEDGNSKRVLDIRLGIVGLQMLQNIRGSSWNLQGIICYEFGRPGHFRKDCPKMRNQNRGNQTRNKNGNKTGNQTEGNETTMRAYAIGGGGTNPDSIVVTVRTDYGFTRGKENFVVIAMLLHKGWAQFCCTREKGIAYASRQLKVHAKNYTTHDLELGCSSVCLECGDIIVQIFENASIGSHERKRIHNDDLRGMINKLELALTERLLKQSKLVPCLGLEEVILVLTWKQRLPLCQHAVLNMCKVLILDMSTATIQRCGQSDENHSKFRGYFSACVLDFRKRNAMGDEPLAIPLDEIQGLRKLTFIEDLSRLCHEVMRLKLSRYSIVKVRWNSRMRSCVHLGGEGTKCKKKIPAPFHNSAPLQKVASTSISFRTKLL